MTTEQKIQNLEAQINAIFADHYQTAKGEIRALFLASTPSQRFLNFEFYYKNFTSDLTQNMVLHIFQNVTPGDFSIRNVVNEIHKTDSFKKLLNKYSK